MLVERIFQHFGPVLGEGQIVWSEIETSIESDGGIESL